MHQTNVGAKNLSPFKENCKKNGEWRFVAIYSSMNYGKRKSIRLPGYDYSQPGSYFVTICTHEMACLFGDINDGKMVLNDLGKIVKKLWGDIPLHFSHVSLDYMVVMPNHVHGILIFDNSSRDKDLSSISKNGTSKTLGSVIRGFKIGVTKWARSNVDIHSVWQRNYYEHVIRNESGYSKICEYIENNPLKWELDSLHPDNYDSSK